LYDASYENIIMNTNMYLARMQVYNLIDTINRNEH